MKRYFFIEEKLDNLEIVEQELLSRGMLEAQVHVLSQDEAGASEHHLHQVHSLLRQDVIHSGEIGALIGLAVSAVSIAIAYFSGLPESIGWTPFIFFSVVLLGFFTWEGGLFGIQVPNSQYRRFDGALKAGKHLLIVDVDEKQEQLLKRVIDAHPHLKAVGTGIAAPRWFVRWQQRWHDFLQWAP
jgi:hypothetical protein